MLLSGLLAIQMREAVKHLCNGMSKMHSSPLLVSVCTHRLYRYITPTVEVCHFNRILVSVCSLPLPHYYCLFRYSFPAVPCDHTIPHHLTCTPVHTSPLALEYITPDNLMCLLFSVSPCLPFGPVPLYPFPKFAFSCKPACY